jgi:hypothetical protein
MARAESKMIMGYLSIEERHYPALLSLVQPATSAHRLFDTFADVEHDAGQTAGLVRKTRSAGGIDVLTVDLDATA